MSAFKIPGACTTCDRLVYEVISVYEPNERYPGEPKEIGLALPGAIKIKFGLFDGSHGDFTFCADCAKELTSKQYTDIWRKTLRTWIREIGGNFEPHMNWFPKQFQNGLLLELGRVSLYKE